MAQNGTRNNGKAKVSMDLKLTILAGLGKLADRDTQQMAVEDLQRIAETLPPESISIFLTCLYDVNSDQKSMVRRESVRFFSILAALYGDLLSPHLQKIVTAIMRRLKDPDSHTRDACVDAMGVLVANVPVPTTLANGTVENAGQAVLAGPLGIFTKPLFDAMNDQNRSVQIGAAMCLARILDNTQDLPAGCVQRLCSRILKFIGIPSFAAKAALLPVIGSLSRAAGTSINPHLSSLIHCLQDSVQGNDWAARKAAAETLNLLAVNLGPALSVYKASSVTLLEAFKFDKVKPARDAVNDALQVWKNIPDAESQSSPPGTSGITKDVSNGTVRSSGTSWKDVIAESRNSGSSVTPDKFSSSVAPSSQALDKRSVNSKKTSSLTGKKTNPDFFKKLVSRNMDDWQIEVAVPRGSPPPSIAQNQDNGSYHAETQANSSAKSGREMANGNGKTIRSLQDFHGETNRSTRIEELVDKFETQMLLKEAKEDLFGNKRAISEDRRIESTSWPLPINCPEEHDDGQDKSWSDNAMATSSESSIIHESTECMNGNELVSIGKQLSELAQGQSDLMGMLQTFMSSSQDNATGLEGRVQRLERAVESIARLMAVSFGNLANGKETGLDMVMEADGGRFQKPQDGGSFQSERQSSGSIPAGVRGRESTYRTVETCQDTFPRTGHMVNRVLTSNRSGSLDAFMRDPQDEYLESDRRKPWRDGGYASLQLGEGPSARSVWRASKDEATLAAIRVVGEDSRLATSRKELSSVSNHDAEINETTSDNKLGEQENGLAWATWGHVLESLHSGDIDLAYDEVLSSGDELLLVRLMNRTGPVLSQLSKGTAVLMLQSITQFLQQQSFLDAAFPWIQQIADMVRISGGKIPSLSNQAKRELVLSLKEASAMEFAERWIGNSVAKLTNQLANAWSVDLIEERA